MMSRTPKAPYYRAKHLHHRPDRREHRRLPVAVVVDAALTGRGCDHRSHHRPRLGRGHSRIEQSPAALVAVAVHHHRGLRRGLSRALSGMGTWKGSTSTGAYEPNTRASRVSTRIASRKPWRRSARAASRSFRPTRPRSTSAATCSSTIAPPATAPMAAARRHSQPRRQGLVVRR